VLLTVFQIQFSTPYCGCSAKARSVLLLHAYPPHCPDVDTDGADHTGRNDTRFVGNESVIRPPLPRPIPSLLFLVHSLERSSHFHSPSPLVSTPIVSLHSLFASHGLSISSGNFDCKQVKTERHARERSTPGSAKDQSATDSGQVLKRPSVP